MGKGWQGNSEGHKRAGRLGGLKSAENRRQKKKLIVGPKRKREEITDMISQKGMAKMKVGQVLKFNLEGSITSIRITRIDRKQWRIWGEHIELVDQKIVASHYGHQVDYSSQPPFCEDCQVSVNEPSTEDGEVKAAEREEGTLSDGTVIE